MAKPVNQLGLLRSIPKYAWFKSNDAIGRTLLENAPHLGTAINVRSLGTRIGQLDRGNSAWWSKHPEYAACLADLLEVSLSDLGLHAFAAGCHLFSFDVFPELPPLDLTREPAWKIFIESRHLEQPDPGSTGRPTLDHWLLPAIWQRHLPTEMDWLHVPDQLERELLSRTLAAAGNFDVLHVEMLSDAGRRLLQPKPLIVTLRAGSGDADMDALARRPDNAGILVIAPNQLPTRERTSSAEFLGWEERQGSGAENRRFRLDVGGMHAPLKRWTWTPLPDWRTQLLAWVKRHLDHPGADTFFSAQDIQMWLSQFDPRGLWFCSVTDMLQLCRISHHSRSSFPAASDANAGEVLMNLLFAHDAALALHVRQLAWARWQQYDLPWEGALPTDAWLALQPMDMADQRGAGAVQPLLSSGWLRQQQHGYFDFQHRTLVNLVIRDKLVRQILDDPQNSWALGCFDQQRRQLVDAALDAVTLPGLAGTIERLQQQAQHSAAAIGASEALFMTLARRIIAGDRPPRAYAIVAQCVLARLDCSQSAWSCPVPWSRPTSTPEEQLAWITACWAWSSIWQPIEPMPENWLFPGWRAPLGKVPWWLTSLWPDKHYELLAPAWEDFFAAAQLWTSDLKEPLANPPLLLRMAMLLEAAHGTWPAQAAWWAQLTGMDSDRCLEDILLKQLQVSASDAAARLWPSLLAFEQTSPDPLIRLSNVRHWMLEQLSAADALTLIDAPSRHYLGKVPESLPPAFRAPLLDALAGTIDLQGDHVLPFFRRFGPSAAMALPQFLADELLGEAAALCLWQWQPGNTARLLRDGIADAAAGRLIDCCPPDQLACAIDLLVVQPELLDAVRRRWWIREHLSHAGAHAGKLLHMMAQLPPDDV